MTLPFDCCLNCELNLCWVLVPMFTLYLLNAYSIWSEKWKISDPTKGSLLNLSLSSCFVLELSFLILFAQIRLPFHRFAMMGMK